jgi:hypothetical protein
MIVLTILFFILSFDILFYTNVYFDITLVLIYLILVAQSALNLESSIKEVKEEYVLKEKSTAYFAYNFGIIIFIVNILVILILYVYVYTSMKRNSIVVTKKNISVVYLNNKKQSMNFEDVDKVEFNWVYNYIGISDPKGNKLILDITLKDFVVIIKCIKVNLPPEMYFEAFNRLSKFYRIFLLKSNIEYLK